jgi:hypothetical protein
MLGSHGNPPAVGLQESCRWQQFPRNQQLCGTRQGEFRAAGTDPQRPRRWSQVGVVAVGGQLVLVAPAMAVAWNGSAMAVLPSRTAVCRAVGTDPQRPRRWSQVGVVAVGGQLVWLHQRWRLYGTGRRWRFCRRELQSAELRGQTLNGCGDGHRWRRSQVGAIWFGCTSDVGCTERVDDGGSAVANCSLPGCGDRPSTAAAMVTGGDCRCGGHLVWLHQRCRLHGTGRRWRFCRRELQPVGLQGQTLNGCGDGHRWGRSLWGPFGLVAPAMWVAQNGSAMAVLPSRTAACRAAGTDPQRLRRWSQVEAVTGGGHLVWLHQRCGLHRTGRRWRFCRRELQSAELQGQTLDGHDFGHKLGAVAVGPMGWVATEMSLAPSEPAMAILRAQSAVCRAEGTDPRRPWLWLQIGRGRCGAIGLGCYKDVACTKRAGDGDFAVAECCLPG